MTQYREILRLHSQGISQRNIALSCACSRNTVSKIIQRAEELGIAWPLEKELTDGELRQRLFAESAQVSRRMAVARGEGIFQRVMKVYKKVPLLILDEWLLVSLKESEARDLLEIVEARHQTGSTIFCSQFAPGGWHSKIGESTLADAILDRIVHSSYTITIEGTDSMRKRKGRIN